MAEKVITNVYNALLKVMKFLVVLLTAALVIVVFANVISRYFLDASLAWSSEAARFLFIWVSFMGIVLAYSKNEHMKFEVLVRNLPEKLGNLVSIVAYLIILVILAILLKGGVTISVQDYSWLTPALEISYGVVYAIVPVCVAILILQTLAKIYMNLKTLFGFSKKL